VVLRWIDYARKKYAAQRKKDACRNIFFVYVLSMENTAEIIEYIGKAALADRVGVTVDRINLAIRQNIMPASWYDSCEKMAGRPLPRTLFTFKGLFQ